MDVRCEKCMTVYEFDDSKVGEQGVTVKCTQCGNLFKVKRRERTAEIALSSLAGRSPAYVPPSGSVPNRVTKSGIPALGKANTVTPAPQPAPVPQAAPTPEPPPEPAGWMIRRASSGEVFRFRELTTLQQWIVERKVTRDDEISRSGEQWKRLGGIAELASFFHVVEQAAAVARADGPRAAAEAASAAYARRPEEDPALVTTAPMPMPERHSGPVAMGSGPVQMRGGPDGMDDPAFARTNPQPRLTPSAVAAHVDDDEDDDFEPQRRRRGGLWAGLTALVVLLAAGGYLAMFQRDAVRGLFAHKDARGDEGYRQGREYFLLDSDDAFRNAVAAFERARDADPRAALPLAGLAEVKTTWAQALRDDARALETGAGANTATTETAAKTLRNEAQADLDDAKRALDDALSLDPESAEVNRAMADYLRVDGAQTAEVERYLARATAKKPADAETAYVAGALAWRDGKLDDAKTKLQQANQLNQQATQHALLRASVLLARIDLQRGDKAAAKQALEPVLAANAQHDRARALMAIVDGAQPMTAPATAAATTTTAPASGQPVAAAAPSAVAASGAAQKSGAKADDTSAGEDYGKLVAQADRLSENGHAKEARKLYERALAQRSDGLEALTGLGYCDLDGERFSSAVDQFKRALALKPGYGEALIGLAEAYKLRGDRSEAVKWYKEYLDKQPNGPKAAMARNNLRDLQPKTTETTTTTTEVKQDAPPPPPPPKAAASDDKKPDDNASSDAPKPDDKPTQLPRLPSNDEPPP